MGFLKFLFGKPTKIENDFFGTMTFVESNKDRTKGYFECSRHFEPSNKLIEIGIDGDITGTTQIQVDFFKSIESNYLNIIASITPLIENEFQNWKPNFKSTDFQKEFDPVYIRTPRCDDKPVIWEISFETKHDPNHVVNLTLSDFEGTEIMIDG